MRPEVALIGAIAQSPTSGATAGEVLERLRDSDAGCLLEPLKEF